MFGKFCACALQVMLTWKQASTDNDFFFFKSVVLRKEVKPCGFITLEGKINVHTYYVCTSNCLTFIFYLCKNNIF